MESPAPSATYYSRSRGPCSSCLARIDPWRARVEASRQRGSRLDASTLTVVERAPRSRLRRPLFETLADSENMPVRVTHVHLTHAPGLVGRRPCYLQSLLYAVRMDRVHVV